LELHHESHHGNSMMQGRPACGAREGLSPHKCVVGGQIKVRDPSGRRRLLKAGSLNGSARLSQRN